MTILVCQKRHHEPHHVARPGWLAWYCTGRPVWPHDRPKPPRIRSADYSSYLSMFETTGVWRTPNPDAWVVEERRKYTTFPTHTEAIMYAQKLAQERKQHGMAEGR